MWVSGWPGPDPDILFHSPFPLSVRYPPWLGGRADAAPSRAGVRLAPHGQPWPVRTAPVLPATDHAGLPVRPRSAFPPAVCRLFACGSFCLLGGFPADRGEWLCIQNCGSEHKHALMIPNNFLYNLLLCDLPRRHLPGFRRL